jgi:uncharacterized protein
MSALENKKLMQEIFAAAGSRGFGDMRPCAVHRNARRRRDLDGDGSVSWSRTFKGKASILNDLHGHVRSRLVDRTRTLAHR